MSKIYVVGIGPGGMEDMTYRAVSAIRESNVIVGYNTYIELIKDHFPDQQFVASGMMQEVERCKQVLEIALEGKTVALVSSGDSGIYGMAGIMLEVAGKVEKRIPVEIIPGVTAASAAAAVLGAPVMHDFAVISLSDLMTPWETIVKRVELAAEGDFVICIYNPKSKKRTEHIGMARDIVLKFRDKSTPVGIVRNAGRINQSHTITTLDEMFSYDIDMFTVVIIGNSDTYIKDGRMITPRGYAI